MLSVPLLLWYCSKSRNKMSWKYRISIFNLIRTRRTKSFSFPVWLCRDFFDECISLFSISLRWIICILRKGLIEKTVWIYIDERSKYDQWIGNSRKEFETLISRFDENRYTRTAESTIILYIYIYKKYTYMSMYIYIYIYKRKKAFFGKS